MKSQAQWEVVIGLESHTQLSTVSKIFSGASTAFGAAPNTHASAVDIALPGVLPVLNKGAVERAIRLGLAVGATINRRSVFARKNYFYPDLPKGYQISQYEIPVVQGGEIAIVSPTRGEIKIRLTRAHLEEDAGKSIHGGFDVGGNDEAPYDFPGDVTGIDLNRAGTPLLEIVSEPDIRSADEAVAYAKTLHSLVRRIGICDGNMQEGSFRCDANVSVRPMGDSKLGTRCEIKNLNSFRFMHEAIEFEVRRQIELIEDGGRVVQETRLYDSDKRETRSMRSKEDAQDYRYFPDPDLPPLVIDQAWIDQIKSTMPESQTAMKARFETTYGIAPHEVNMLTEDLDKAEYFEATVRALGGNAGDARLAANWISGELSAILNRQGLEIAESHVSPGELAKVLSSLRENKISALDAKQLLRELADRPVTGQLDVTLAPATLTATGTVEARIAALSLEQISDSGAIEKIVAEVLDANAAIVAEVKAGKEKAFNALVGKIMAATKGKANPAQVNAILKQRLGT
jgi:aspartyl-tRNA(Asn)/glutamyl-tRNA(Gln) amidotransferase subunit B